MQSLPHLSSRAPLTLVQPTGSISLDWMIAVLSTWMIGGIQMDAWAHHQYEVETFFTPWHGVLYAGFLATALALVGAFVRNLWRNHPWQQATPSGYSCHCMASRSFSLAAWATCSGTSSSASRTTSKRSSAQRTCSWRWAVRLSLPARCAPDGRAVRRRWDGRHWGRRCSLLRCSWRCSLFYGLR